MLRVSRVDALINVFNGLYRNMQAEPNGGGAREWSVSELFTLIDTGTFLTTDVNESQLFQYKTRDELIQCVTGLYQRYKISINHDQIVTALLLSRLFGFYLPNTQSLISIGTIPFKVINYIEDQQYHNALAELETFILEPQAVCESILKGIGMAFHGCAFQLLEQQVQQCIRGKRPSLFEQFSADRYLLRVPARYATTIDNVEIPVRIELTSCVGSDIFFLSMTRPDKGRCINISVDLFNEESQQFESPIHVITRPIREKGIRLTSIDLSCSKLVTSLDDLFNMRNDDLSLLKAAVVASGIIPPAAKDAGDLALEHLLQKLLGDTNAEGFELITRVIRIPRGSGLAVSTNLLAGMIISLMRFSGQFTGDVVTEELKRETAIRAIYAEWLGGSGGGWQDYGGMWGGFKEIKGTAAQDCVAGYAGDLLPLYEEMTLPDHTAEAILSSMVLINGGTGQDVGPILKMIALQFVTKNDIAWSARKRTEANYEKIRQALLEGDVEKIAALENADFINRVDISPLANNLFHEMLFERLTAVFGDDVWGYDATGGRAGAGGVFWVNPEKKALFENAFTEICREVQHELRGQMHFVSEPLVYQFRLNKKGVSFYQYGLADADRVIGAWKQSCTHAIDNNTIEQIHAIKSTYGFHDSLFQQLQHDYRAGILSLRRNTYAAPEQINVQLHQSRLKRLPLPTTAEYRALHEEGLSYLKYPIAYVTLNGGESTRYGANVIRSLNPSIYLDGKYRSPLELKMGNIKFMRDVYGADIFPVFTNGYFTDRNTNRVLKSNRYFGIPADDIYSCTHSIIHRIVPTIADLDFWFERIREKPTTEREEILAGQYHDAMKTWIHEKGEGTIYEAAGKNKVNTLVSPGHFFSFMSLVTSGVLGKLLKRDVRHLVISSNDNLASTLDPAVLAMHVKHGNDVTSEVVPRLFDRGGAPVIIDGKIQIFEDFRFPDQETLWKTPYFNPITSWMKIDALIELLGLSEHDIIQLSEGSKHAAARCAEAVNNLAHQLATYPVLKHLQEDMGNGISYLFPVIQFEKLFGDLISKLNPEFLLVPKLMRHTQIKSIDHIYQVYNDQSLQVIKSQITLSNSLQQIEREGVAI